jgi:hypothetical protein
MLLIESDNNIGITNHLEIVEVELLLIILILINI